MLNNFIYAKTKDLFIEQLEAHQILDEAIVFIEDTKEIWNHGTYFAGISDSELDQLNSKIIFDYTSFGLPNISEQVLTEDQVMTACGMSATDLYNKVRSGTEVAFKVTPDEGMEMVFLAINVSIQENWFAISFTDLFMLVYDNGTISVIFDFALGYQQRLVSGTNIKTINGQSLLGEGDITISTDVDLTDYALKEDIPTTTSQLTNDSGFLTEHQDISHKQDVINDLNDIRQKANSALQNVPDEYITETELNTAINSVAFTEDYGSEVVMPVSNIVSMSQEAYDALTEKNPNTIYLIV